ncbi:histidine kinase [uncultured Winogradskyella sp.]|uniref:histidine kinase n=1 Tax=uncultured Winogradskyella sp. TaxID=395353 RepID=UPI00262B5BE9|nr:histidine kinase [uncultured Winogradskyella sp.]
MKKLTKNILVAFFIGVTLFVLDSSFNGGFKYDSFNQGLVSFLNYQLYSFVISLSNFWFFDFLDTRTWKERQELKRVIVGFVGSVVITLICMFLLNMLVKTTLEGKTITEFIKNENIANYQFALWITISVVAVAQIIYFYNRAQKNKIKEQKVIAGAASAKFDALKNQLDPHFLFNSLNVLTSLIEENPNSAQKFTTSLSKVYRYVLEQKSKELITVDEELNFARTYMLLLKMRFEDSIIFEIPDKASNPEAKVVPLSLQLLLENAVKHNTVTSSRPLHIKIYEDGNHLVVMNNLQPKQIVKKSSGVGLENIKQRYNLLTERKVYINESDKDFAVAIPMLTKQVSIMRSLQKSSSRLNDDYMRARNRVEELKAFYYSLISYCLVIPFLIFIWYQYSRYTIQWFWFPILGWGLSLVIQAYRVFVDNGAFGINWEKKKIEEYMRRDEERNRYN